MCLLLRRQDDVVVVGDAVATLGVITRRSSVLAFVLACDSAEVFRSFRAVLAFVLACRSSRLLPLKLDFVVDNDAVATFGVITRRSPVLAFVLACDSAEVFRSNQEHPHAGKGTTLRLGASCCCFGAT